MCSIFNFLNFILILLLLYMFLRLISCLYKKDIIHDIDVFYITSNPWEYKRNKNKFKNQEGS